MSGWQHGGVSGQLSRRVARRANGRAASPVRPHRQGPPDLLLQGRARARHRAAGTASARQGLGRRGAGRAGGDAVRARVGSQIPRRVPVWTRGGRRGDGHERAADDRGVGHRAGDARGVRADDPQAPHRLPRQLRQVFALRGGPHRDVRQELHSHVQAAQGPTPRVQRGPRGPQAVEAGAQVDAVQPQGRLRTERLYVAGV